MTKKIIAIFSTTGPGSGKTTYLETVVRKQFPNAEHLRFSDPIISFLCDGLHCLHALDPAFYASILKKRIEASKADVIIIDDLRKVPELAMLGISPWSVLFVNVKKPSGGTNDCEFLWTAPYMVANNSNGTMRYMEVTWDSKGSFISSYRRATP